MTALQAIAPGLYRVPEVVANVYVLVEPAGVTLIDTGLPYSHKRILPFVARLGQGLRRILITHADRDHVGSVAALAAHTGARVTAGALEGAAMALGQETRRLKLNTRWRLALKLLRPLFVPLTPGRADEVVAAGDIIPVWGGLHVLATPGHTPGHLSFYAPGPGVLFAGDSLRVIGRRLRVSSGPNTLDEAEARDSARRQLALQPRLICTGHGPPMWAPFGQDLGFVEATN